MTLPTGGLRNSWGVCRFYNGDYYEGQWSKGLRDGRGMQQVGSGVGPWHAAHGCVARTFTHSHCASQDPPPAPPSPPPPHALLPPLTPHALLSPLTPHALLPPPSCLPAVHG